MTYKIIRNKCVVKRPKGYIADAKTGLLCQENITIIHYKSIVFMFITFAASQFQQQIPKYIRDAKIEAKHDNHYTATYEITYE